MKAEELYKDIQKYCRANADKAVVKKYSRYFTEGYDAYGLSREKYEAKVKTILEDKNINMKLVLSTAKLLVKSGKYEETSFAIGLLKEFSEQFDLKTFAAVEKWFQLGIVNWGHCDVLCSYLMTPFFNRKIISLKDLSGWLTAKNKYQRRAVPVAMLELLETTKNFKPLFTFIELLMMDPEHKVQQGLGWFLREAWKIKKKETEGFLLKWKDKAPRTIYQYATEKMTAKEKKRFRKDKDK
ncbi:MAG: DNA alkylation repair protein [Candidatus Hodarchaeota archaeon]